jgi:hypothetical protein
MPNITPSQKGGTSVDSSDLLVQKKRNIYLAISKQNVAKGGFTQVANRQIGYDNGFSELRSKRGLDMYFNKVPSSIPNPGPPLPPSPTGVSRQATGAGTDYNIISWTTPTTGTVNVYYAVGPTITLANRINGAVGIQASLGGIAQVPPIPPLIGGLRYTVAVVTVVNAVESPLNGGTNTVTFYNTTSGQQ